MSRYVVVVFLTVSLVSFAVGPKDQPEKDCGLGAVSGSRYKAPIWEENEWISVGKKLEWKAVQYRSLKDGTIQRRYPYSNGSKVVLTGWEVYEHGPADGEGPVKTWRNRETISEGAKAVFKDVEYRQLASGLVQRRWPYSNGSEIVTTPWKDYEQGPAKGEKASRTWTAHETISVGDKAVFKDVEYRELASGLVQRRWPYSNGTKTVMTQWQDYERGPSASEAAPTVWTKHEFVSVGDRLVGKTVEYRRLEDGTVQRRWPYWNGGATVMTTWNVIE